ncbi:hypothetical protein [Microbacterium sp.]|uniref:hypothetical protein n=1 Tax=Microbacterium sp. TaxID=51671 RepID=UPI003F71426E
MTTNEDIASRGPDTSVPEILQQSWKQITGVRDWRALLLANATGRPGDVDAFPDWYREIDVSADGSISISNIGRKYGNRRDREWVVETAGCADLLQWEDCGTLAEDLRRASVYTRILNAEHAISIPGTWTAHPTLTTVGVDMSATMRDDDSWRIGPQVSSVGICIGRFVEVGRERVDRVAHTILVSVDDEDE